MSEILIWSEHRLKRGTEKCVTYFMLVVTEASYNWRFWRDAVAQSVERPKGPSLMQLYFLTDVGSDPERDHLLLLRRGRILKEKYNNPSYASCEANAELSSWYGSNNNWRVVNSFAQNKKSANSNQIRLFLMFERWQCTLLKLAFQWYSHIQLLYISAKPVQLWGSFDN